MSSSEFCFEIPLGSKTISASFDGGSLSSDAGVVLLREVGKKLRLTDRLADCIRDGRDRSRLLMVGVSNTNARLMNSPG